MKKNIIYVTSIIMCATVTIFLQFAYRTAEKGKGIEEEYTRKLTAQETNVWDLITTETGITKHDCIQRAQEQQKQIAHVIDKKAQQATPLSHELRASVQKHLEERGLPLDTIRILSAENSDCGASASVDALIIDQATLERYTPEERAYVLAHEVVHLVYRDPEIQHACMTIFQEKNLLPEKEHLLFLLSRFCEERADTLAFASNESCTVGGIQRLTAQRGMSAEDQTAPTHPSCAERLAWAQEIQAKHHATDVKIA